MVYENEKTGERQAWFPTEAAADAGVDPKKKELMEKNKKALEAYKNKKVRVACDKKTHSLFAHLLMTKLHAHLFT